MMYYRRRRAPAQTLMETLAAPEDRPVPAQEMKCVQRMVRLLPADSRDALLLADEQGVAQQAIADRFGISLSGAKSRVQRARRDLREMVLDCCDVEFDSRGGIVDYQPTQRAAQYCDTACAA
jgi:RNA polymerase sigma-70 factor, ECF subfamily